MASIDCCYVVEFIRILTQSVTQHSYQIERFVWELIKNQVLHDLHSNIIDSINLVEQRNSVLTEWNAPYRLKVK